MASFVLTAKLVLLPPSNIEDVVRLLNSKLASVKTRVDITVPAKTLNGLDKLNTKVRQTEESILSASRRMDGFNASIQRAANSSARLSGVSSGGNTGGGGGRASVSRKSPFEFSQPVNTGRSVGQINQLSSSTIKLARATKQATDEFDKFGHQAAISLRRFGAFTIAAGTFIKLGQAITSGISHAISFDLQMTKLSQVLSISREGVKGLDNEITRLSTNLGVSSSSIADVALTLAQAGLSAQNTKIALEVLAQTELAPTFENISNTGEAAIAVLAQFGGEAKDLAKDFSEINTIAAKFAVESSDLTTAISKAGGTFAASGGSLRELLALFTSVRATTRESADSIATGFRTIFARLQRPQTQSFLKTLGVELRDLEGQFVGPYEAIRRISTALKDVPATSPLFAKTIEEIGGYRQISRVIPLIQQFNVAEQARVAALSASGSLTEDAAKAQESFFIKLSKVREEYLATMRAFSQDSMIKTAIDGLLKLASAFNQVLSTIKPLAPALALLGLQGVLPNVVRGFRAFSKGPDAKFAAGGVVPGVGDNDSVNAMLTPGEFVIKKKSAQAIGYENLHRMNKYAVGGKAKKKSNFLEDPREVMLLADEFELSGGIDSPMSFFAGNTKITGGKPTHVGLSSGLEKYIEALKIIKGKTGIDARKAHNQVIGMSRMRSSYNGGPFDKVAGLFSGQNKNIYFDTDSTYKYGAGTFIEEILHSYDDALGKGDSLNFGTVPNQIANLIGTSDKGDTLSKLAYIDGMSMTHFHGQVEKYYNHPAERFAKAVKLSINPSTSDRFHNMIGSSKSERLKDLIGQLSKKFASGGVVMAGGIRDEKFYQNSKAINAAHSRLVSMFGINPNRFAPGGVGFADKITYGPSETEQRPIRGFFRKSNQSIMIGKSADRRVVLEEYFHAIDHAMASKAFPYASYGRDISKKQEIGGYQVSGSVGYNPAARIAALYSDDASLNYIANLTREDRLTEKNRAYKSDKTEIFSKVMSLIADGKYSKLKAFNPDKAEELRGLYYKFGDQLRAKNKDYVRAPDTRARAYFGKKTPKYSAALQDYLATPYPIRTSKVISSPISLTSGFSDISGKDWLKTIGIAGGGTLAAFGGIAALLSFLGNVSTEYETAKQREKELDLKLIGVRGYNSGGNVVGGYGDRDTIPALLTPGEFVFNKKSAQAIGYDKLHNMNKYARYATGGAVKGGSFNAGGIGTAAIGAAYFAPAIIGPVDELVKTFTGLDNAIDKLTQIVITSAVGFSIVKKALDSLKNYQAVSDTQKYKKSDGTTGFRTFSEQRTASITGNIRAKETLRRTTERHEELKKEREKELQHRKDDLSSRISELDKNRQVKTTIRTGEGQPYVSTYTKAKTPEQVSLEKELQSAKILSPGQEEREVDKKRRQTRATILNPKSKFSNAEIAKQDALQKSAQASAIAVDKWNTRLNVSTAAIAALSIAAVELGSYFSSLSSRKYESGDIAGARAAAQSGGGFNGAGFGATLGAGLGAAVGGTIGTFVGGPAGTVAGVAAGTTLGTTIGGTLGGGVGYLTGSYQAGQQFDEMVRVDKFNKEGERLGRNAGFDVSRQEFDQNRATQSISGLVNLRKQQFDSAKDKSTAKSAIGNDLGTIDTYLQRTAQEFAETAKVTGNSAKAMEDFKKATDDIRKFYADFTNSTLEDVDSRFKVIIDDSTKIVAANEKLIKAANELSVRIERINLIIGAIAAVTDSLRTFEAAIKMTSERAFGNISGTSYQDSQILQNPESVTNFKELERRTREAGSVFGVAGDEAATTAVEGAKIFNQLPMLLSDAANAGLLNNDDDTKALLEEKFGKDNPQVQSIIDALNAKLNQGGNRDQNINELQRDPRGFSSSIAGGVESLIKPFQAAESAINRELTKYSQGLAVRRQIEYKYIDMLNDIIDMRSQKEMDLAEAQERDVDFNKIYANLESQLSNILPDFKGGKAQNLDEIEKDLGASRNRINQLDSALANGVGADGKSIGALDKRSLEREKDAQIERYERNKKALEFIGSGKGINAIKGELNRERSRRNTTKDYFKEYTFSDNAGRRDMVRGFRSAQAIAVAGNANVVSGENRQRAAGFLERFKDIKLDALGGKTGKEVQDAATAAELKRQGFSDADIKSIITATPKEEKLIAALENAYDAAEKANKILADDLKENQKTLVQNLDESFRKFLDELKNILIQKEVDNNDRKQETNKSEQNSVDRELENRKKIKIAGKYATDDEISSLQKTEKARRDLLGLKEQETRGIDIASGSNTNPNEVRKFLGDKKFDELNVPGGVPKEVFDAAIAQRQAEIKKEQEAIRNQHGQSLSVVPENTFKTKKQLDDFYDNGKGSIYNIELEKGSTKNLERKKQTLKEEQDRLKKSGEELKKRIDKTNTPEPSPLPSEVTHPDYGNRLPGMFFNIVPKRFYPLDYPSASGGAGGVGFGSIPPETSRMSNSRKTANMSLSENTSQRDNTNPMASFDKSMSNFLASATSLGEAMNNFPRSVSIEGNIKVEAIINGAAVLQEIQPGIAKLVTQAVNNAMGTKAKQDKVS